MGDDGKKLPNNNNLVDNSSLLTDWLFKHRLDNISYISASPSIHSQILKSVRKGGIFDSRDVIRPTVQLFKNIKNKSKRRNESPSPQRIKAKVSTVPSPTKESNRVFSHRGGGEDSLDVYRKIFTYGRVKQDRVSKDKIESAVALFRQREQNREASATRASAPEKVKKFDNAKTDVKAKIRTTPNKPTTKENCNRTKESWKSGDKQRDSREINVPSKDYLTEVETRSGDGKFNKGGETEVKSAKTVQTKVKSPNKRKSSEQKIEESYEESSRQGKGECVDEIENQSAKINTDTVNEINKDALNTKHVKTINFLNNPNEPEGNQLSVINFAKYSNSDYHQVETQSRKSLIKSLKSKYSRLDVIKDSVPARKQMSADYIIVKPALSNYEAVSASAPTKPNKTLTPKKSVDDLLKEYRIKYRNMMKVR